MSAKGLWLMDPYDFPSLFCPFQALVSPHAAALDHHTIDWIGRFGLMEQQAHLQRFAAARFGWLAAYLAPSLSLEGLQLLSDWNTWAIIWDDVCDTPELQNQPALLAARHAQFLAVLHGAEPQASPLASALHDIRQRLLRHAPAGRLHRFAYHVEEFFAGCEWEATNRALGRVPDVPTYIQMRRLTSGMYTSLKLAELVDGIDLPLHVWKHPDIERLRMMATNAVCWANDIISLQKEQQRQDTHNLVLALQHAHGLTLDAALEQVASLHDAEVETFVATERRLPSFGIALDAHVQRYCALLRSFMYGNLAWSAVSGRYKPSPCAEPTQVGLVVGENSRWHMIYSNEQQHFG